MLRSADSPGGGRPPARSSLREIVLGGGCFWCMEAVFQQIPGVVEVTPGYAGGWKARPTYAEVCTGTTGHAEVVRVVYDPRKVDLSFLLDVFFHAHDPTTPDRQGPDVGPQYRSIILYGHPEDEPVIRRAMHKHSRRFRDPIVTEVRPLEAFWPAEAYHHRYAERNPHNPYCRLVIQPKVKTVQALLSRLRPGF